MRTLVEKNKKTFWKNFNSSIFRRINFYAFWKFSISQKLGNKSYTSDKKRTDAFPIFEKIFINDSHQVCSLLLLLLLFFC